VQHFRGALVCKAHRLLFHSTLGLRVIQQKKKPHYPTSRASYKGLFRLGSRVSGCGSQVPGLGFRVSGLKVQKIIYGFGFRLPGFGVGILYAALIELDQKPQYPTSSSASSSTSSTSRAIATGTCLSVLNLKTTTSQKGETIPRRARI